jgi:hypothetical protein
MNNKSALCAVLALLLIHIDLFSQTKPRTQFVIPTVEAAPGEEVCLEITTVDFRNLIGLQMGIKWDSTALKLLSYQSPQLDMPPHYFNVPAADSSLLLMTWTNVFTQTLADGSVFLELCFAVKEDARSTFAFVSVDDDFLDAIVAVDENMTGNPSVDARFYPGGVQINAPGNDLRLSSEVEAYQGCNGDVLAVSLNPSGGNPPYNFFWTGPGGFLSEAEDPVIPGEGLYHLTLTDQSGQTMTGNFNLNIIRNESEGPLFIADAQVAPTNCNKFEGSVALTLDNDPADYTVRWDNGRSGLSINNLPSGDYTVSITNEEGCRQVKTYTVAGTGAIQYQRVQEVLPCDGTPAQIGVEMENAPFFLFSWDDGSYEPLIAVEEARTYSLTIENGIYCREEVVFNVEADETVFDLEVLENDITCTEGTATIGITNPRPEWTYNWSHAEIQMPLATVNEPGEYRLTVGNAYCSKEVRFNVQTDRESFVLEKLEADISCAEGTAVIGITNGNSDFDYAWVRAGVGHLGIKEPQITVSEPGAYGVEVANTAIPGCAEYVTFEVGYEEIGGRWNRRSEDLRCDRPVVTIGFDSIEQEAGLGFLWSTGHESHLMEATTPGVYALTITKGDFCAETEAFSVGEEAFSFELDVLNDDLGCGSPQATIGVSVPGDTAGMTFFWPHSEETAATVIVDQIKTYEIQVRKGDCEERYFPKTVKNDERLRFDRLRPDFTCEDTLKTIGVANADTTRYTYFWENGERTPTIDVRQSGSYRFTITESPHCSTFNTIYLEAPWEFNYREQKENLGCLNDEASIGVISQDTVPYRYRWDTGDTTDFISVTEPGTYRLEIKKGAFCRQEAWFQVFTSSSRSLFQRVDGTRLSCQNSATTIGVNYPDTLDLRFSWNTGDTTHLIEVNEPGRYTLMIDGGPHCMEQFDFNVHALDPSSFFQWVNGHLGCFDQEATIGLQNPDSLDVRFRWNTGDTTNLIQVRNPARYALTIDGGPACQTTYDFNVYEIDQSDRFMTVSEDLTCTGSPATVGVMYEGDPDLNFRWNTGATTPLVEVDQAGIYTLDIDGGEACRKRITFGVDPPEGLSYDRVEYPLICGEPGARIGVEMGAPRPYEFNWSNGEEESLLEISESGYYELTITDPETGCRTYLDFEVRPPVLESPEIRVRCPAGNDCELFVVEARQFDGEGPFVYTWSTGQVDTAMISRIGRSDTDPVSVEIKDARGCSVLTENIQLNCPPENSADEMQLRYYFSCETMDSSSAVESIIHAEILRGGTPPYSFEWYSGERDASYYMSKVPFRLEEEEFFGVTVTDAVGTVKPWLFSRGDQYGCGTDDNSVEIFAPHMTVAPGSQFGYPIHASGFDSLEVGILTIDWDACLLQADSLVLYYPERSVSRSPFLFEGVEEIDFRDTEGAELPDTAVIARIYFRARENIEGISPFLFSINEPGRYTDGSSAFFRTSHGSITIAGQQALVRPGDTDVDQRVDHFDLLNLGLFYRGAGPDRRSRWTDSREYGLPWQQATPVSDINLKHLDCNGDGLINALDTMVIAQNWDIGLWDEDRTIEKNDGPDLLVQADTLWPGASQSFPILLGRENFIAEGVYGIALTVRYDADLIDAQSVSVDFANSWLNSDTGSPLLFISRNDPEQRRIHLSVVRTDQSNADGYGELARLHFATLNPEERTAAAFAVENVRLLNAREEILPVNGMTTFASVAGTTSLNPFSLESYIQLHPVPAGNWLRIECPADWRLQRADLFDIKGRLLRSQPPQDRELDVSALPPGVFFLRLTTDRGVVVKRWVKK